MSALFYRARLRPVVEAVARVDDRPRSRFVADPPGRTALPPATPPAATPATRPRRPRPSDAATPGWLGRLPAVDAAATAWTGPGGAEPDDRRIAAPEISRRATPGCRWLVLAMFLAALWRALAGGVAT